MGELMKQTFSAGNLYGDPRIPLRLDRYRIVTKGMKDDYPMRLILGHVAWEWTRWQSVSPGNAEAWRDTLPPDEPLLLIWILRLDRTSLWISHSATVVTMPSKGCTKATC